MSMQKCEGLHCNMEPGGWSDYHLLTFIRVSRQVSGVQRQQQRRSAVGGRRLGAPLVRGKFSVYHNNTARGISD